jgi:hypothetical protein
MESKLVFVAARNTLHEMTVEQFVEYLFSCTGYF